MNIGEREIYIIAGIFVGFVVGYFIGKIIKHFEIKKHRNEAVRKSRSVILGESYEKLVPISGAIPYFSKDMNFVGKGVDYIVFDGLSDGNLKKIVFLEVKTGRSQLNKNERQIEKAIKEKRISYEIIRLKNSRISRR